ncbi:MAG: DEAD/DEAH box helicase [Deltaproteobacteria bacterium]|jgi:ATP-dependent RNA helicase DeaD|nr:DEAD/DEAH box helicase [Deltaproteobacteria bacterium]
MSQTNFSDLNLCKELLKGVVDLGFEEPSPIQALAIPLVLEGRDLVGQAQTGTGKTAAFGLPALQKINARSKKTQALVLCPTRELAVQVAGEVSALAAHLRGIAVLPVYGGQALDRQIRALQRGVQFVVGTPGRVLDHLERGTLNLEHLELLVLDEADEMLDMGFREDIESVLTEAPENCQKICFSATMPKDILSLIQSHMREPEFVRIQRKEITVAEIEQVYYEVRPYRKAESLCLVLDVQDFNKGIVFCSTKLGADELASQLMARGYQADVLHGNLSQGQRDRVMGRFRGDSLDLLVATDVAARGLDIDDVDIVVNFDVPFDVESYVHRIGRTGRAGRSGKAITFVTARESYKVREISRYTKAEIRRGQLPSKREVSDLKTTRLLGEVLASVEAMREARQDFKKADRYTLLLESLVDDESSEMDVAAALLKMLIERDQIWPSAAELEAEKREQEEQMRRYESRSDKGARPGGHRDERAAREGRGPVKTRGRRPNMARLFFNLGSKGRVTPSDFVGAITGETGLPGRVVGDIEIHDRFSFVEVPEEHAETIMKAMSKTQIRGLRVAVDIAKPV